MKKSLTNQTFFQNIFSPGKKKNGLEFWLFVGPLVLGLIVFVYIPIIWGFFLSFFEARNTVVPTKFVGLTNYIELFKDQRFVDSLETVIIFPFWGRVFYWLAGNDNCCYRILHKLHTAQFKADSPDFQEDKTGFCE